VVVASQNKNKPNQMDLYAPYLDADAIRDRLEEVITPGGWSLDLEAIGDKAVICRLTVLGVTRAGLGEIGDRKDVDQPMKSAATDALKRAAVEFGIGRYLHKVNKEWRKPKAGPPASSTSSSASPPASPSSSASPPAPTSSSPPSPPPSSTPSPEPTSTSTRPGKMSPGQQALRDVMDTHGLKLTAALDALGVVDGGSPEQALKLYIDKLVKEHRKDREWAWKKAADNLLDAMKARDGLA
jgi:hypothetical protein